jgi:hypothetical protein
MDQRPLVSDDIETGADLVKEFAKFSPVQVAFWLKATDENQRFLYIASDAADNGQRTDAYRQVLKIIAKLQPVYFDPFQVKLIRSDDALAKAAISIRDRFPARIGTHLGGNLFAGILVDDVYIYPQ